MSYGKIQRMEFSSEKVFIVIKDVYNSETLKMDITKELLKRFKNKKNIDSQRERICQMLENIEGRVVIYSESKDKKCFTSGQLVHEFFPDNQRAVFSY